MCNNLPFLELRGSPKERGYSIGFRLRDLIQQEVKEVFKLMRNLSSLSSTRKNCLRLSNKYLPYAKSFAPELVEEIEGISEGAGIEFEDVFFLNIFDDIAADISNPKLASKLLGCTSIGVANEATLDGEVFVGQTFDFNILFQRFQIILKINNKSSPNSLIYTIAGMLGFSGQNSHGVTVVNNKLFASDSRPGVPFNFIIRKILEKKTIDNSIEIILNAHRTTGMNYLMGSSRGNIIDIETTARYHEILYPKKDVITHSNHYLTKQLKKYQYIEHPDSCMRFDQISNLLKERHGRITLEFLKNCLTDHLNYPKSICNHPSPQLEKYRRMKTLSALIMQPKTGKLFATMGNPCQNNFAEYNI
jgi:isopenicillin-N N-acyltransferase-like protein